MHRRLLAYFSFPGSAPPHRRNVLKEWIGLEVIPLDHYVHANQKECSEIGPWSPIA